MKSAVEYHRQFKDGQVSAEEIVNECLSQIQTHDGDVGAFLKVLDERALASAKALDQKRKAGEPLGRLAGVPIAIKDNIHIKGELSTCASKFLTNYVAPFDATAVRLLEAEDAILIGKTNLDEFAMGSANENSALQKTRNPWNLEHSTGGSSGGSAAAVAARYCPLSLGSDTGGSIRQPASFTGIMGFKPTYGRVSRFGLVAFGSSLDQIGPFARSAKDLAMAMEVIGAHCDRDSTSLRMPVQNYLQQMTGSMAGQKVGVPWKFLEGLDEKPRALFDASLETMKGLGAEIVEVDLDLLNYSIAVYYILATAEASTNLARFDGVRYGQRSSSAKTLAELYDLSRQEGFGPEVKRRIMLGTFVLSAGYQDAYYKKAQKIRRLIIEQYAAAFKQADLIAMPTTPGSAFKSGSIRDPIQMYLEDVYTIGANMGGLPAVSVPCGFSDENMPFGLQLVGPAMEDGRVLAAADAFESAHKLGDQLPAILKVAS